MINPDLVPSPTSTVTSRPTLPNKFSDAGIGVSAKLRAGFALTQKRNSERIAELLESRFNLPPELSQGIASVWLDDARSCVHHLGYCRCGGVKCMRCGQSSIYHRPCKCEVPQRQSERIRVRRRASADGSLYQLP